MSKRYVFFDATLQQGGAERVIALLSGRMAENAEDTKILLYYDEEIFYEIDPRIKIDVVEKHTKTKNILKNILWMRKYFKNHADVVISFLAPFNILSLIATFGLKTSIVVADRNDPRHVPENKYVRKVRDFLYRFADGVVLQTRYNQAYFPTKIQDNSTIIFNPINLGEKAGAALTCEKRKEIVSVGRLMPQKNQKMLIEAFARVHRKFPEYTLVIYGDGPCREQLETMTRELGVEQNVLFPGSVKDLHDRIVYAELFVLSSDYEGMPNALTEAMCLGLPAISTAVSGATDLIAHNENGLLVSCGDTDAMADAIEKMLSDRELREKCAESAVALNERLAVDSICSQWIRYIDSLS